MNNKNISKIIEQRDGNILLQFGSYRDPLPPRLSSYNSRAFSEYCTGQSSADLETEIVNQNIRQDNSIRFKAPVAEPKENIYPISPTPSNFNQ